MRSLIRHLLSIEEVAYPAHMQQMRNLGVRSMSDLLDYCEVSNTEQVLILTGPGWYFLAGKHEDEGYVELVDLASNGKVPNIFRIARELMKFAGDLEMRSDLRVDTSWPLVKVLCRRYNLHITSTFYSWDGVDMVEVMIQGETD